jgi:protein-disulfide isomerase
MIGLWRIITPLIGLLVTVGTAYADLEKTLINSHVLDKAPLAIAQSVSDGRLFILLEGGEVQIFSADGHAQERFMIGDGFTSLEVSPDGQMLYLGNAKSKELQFIELTFVQALPVNNSAVKGPEDAPVTITLFSDFQCPYCARLLPTMEQVMQAYPKQVRMVFKQFPLSMHPFAQPAALASLAARNQAKFWPLHDQLFANYNKLNDVLIRQLAEGVGVDMARFDKDLATPALQQEVAADTQLGVKAGVRGTPAAYINGKQLKDRSFNGFKQMIDAELKNAAK